LGTSLPFLTARKFFRHPTLSRPGALWGALSLVKSLVEPWTVNAGIPSRVIGRRDRSGTLAWEQLLVRMEIDGE
jgi:hypothetical protein